MDNKPYLTASPKQGVDLLIVPVADKWFEPVVTQDEEGVFFHYHKLNGIGVGVPLPPGSYTFLFCSNNANEEQARGIVASQMERGAVFNPEVGHYQSAGWTTYYRNYEHYPATSICIPNTAIESLQSLIRSLGLDPSGNYAFLLINKI